MFERKTIEFLIPRLSKTVSLHIILMCTYSKFRIVKINFTAVFHAGCMIRPRSPVVQLVAFIRLSYPLSQMNMSYLRSLAKCDAKEAKYFLWFHVIIFIRV